MGTPDHVCRYSISQTCNNNTMYTITQILYRSRASGNVKYLLMRVIRGERAERFDLRTQVSTFEKKNIHSEPWGGWATTDEVQSSKCCLTNCRKFCLHPSVLNLFLTFVESSVWKDCWKYIVLCRWWCRKEFMDCVKAMKNDLQIWFSGFADWEK